MSQALLAAIVRLCLAAGRPLDDVQQQIILQILTQGSNPLDQLTPEQRSTLLRFIQSQPNLEQFLGTSPQLAE
jgi:hypothetical protein